MWVWWATGSQQNDPTRGRKENRTYNNKYQAKNISTKAKKANIEPGEKMSEKILKDNYLPERTLPGLPPRVQEASSTTNDFELRLQPKPHVCKHWQQNPASASHASHAHAVSHGSLRPSSKPRTGDYEVTNHASSLAPPPSTRHRVTQNPAESKVPAGRRIAVRGP